MAIYHCSIKIISRGKGKSAVGAAAYRAGEKITNDYDGETHDYTKKGGIVYTEILLPANAPKEYTERSFLWNAVEKIEKAKNSQLAREIELALPKELSVEKQTALAREYCQKYFVSVGMCADICIHDKQDGNPHAHIMLTMRPLEPDGNWGAKSRKEYILDDSGNRVKLPSGEYKSRKVNTVDWNEQTKAEEWRQGWADIVNQLMANESLTERIDHRSYERQGIEQIPTVHMGVAASQMERKGIATERGDHNRKAKAANDELRQLRARLDKINKSLVELEEVAQDNIPSLYKVIDEVLGGENKSQRQKVSDLKKAADIRNFLVSNNITTVSELRDKVMELYRRRDDISNKMKPIERRQKTLAEHIKQAEYYLQFRDIYKQYTQQKPKYKETFKECHLREIILYEAAKKYLDERLNGHNLPLKSWKSEVAKLQNEKDSLYRQFTTLKEEVREVEIIKRNVEQLMRDNGHERTAMGKSNER